MSMLLDISNNPWVGSIMFTRMWGNAYAGSDQRISGGPCCCTSLISVYVQQMPCHREMIVPKTCQSPGEIAKVLHTQASAVTPMKDRREGMPRYPQTSELPFDRSV